jgi:general secretion pathway protein D
MVSKITHKNILLTKEIRGKVNFISVKPIKDSDIYTILLNILKSKGYTLVDKGDFLVVVKNADALREAPSLANSKNQEIQTDIIYLKNIPARVAYTQINYLNSRYGKIVVNSDKNLLIITDYPRNLKIIKEILTKIDTQNQNKVTFIKLKNANVQTIFLKVKEITSNLFNNKIFKYKLIENDDSNSIIIVGNQDIIKTLKPIIKNLDVAPKPVSQITKIFQIKNSDVSNLEKLITNIVKHKFKKNLPSITADKETNSIIVVANQLQIDTIKTIIDALDIPKEQVYVKVRVLEISNKKANTIGLKYGMIGGVANSSGLYSMSANLGGPAIAFDTTALGIATPTLTKGLALGITLDLLESEGAAKKLSEPSILCINNTESSIYVGQTESIITQSTVGANTTDLTKNTYSRQDIGLTLKVKPRIDSDNKVSLSVKAILEDILPGSQVGLPTTTKRDIDTTTIVTNGQSVIIGGLVRDNKSITISKVPFLGDIPFLGALFRHKSSNVDKTTLVMVLTPYIIKKSGDLDKLRLTLAKLNTLEKNFVHKLIKEKK